MKTNSITLTESQKHWLKKHKLEVGNVYSIPGYSFYIYEHPKFSSGQILDLPPNKTTSNILFRLVTIDETFLGGYFVVSDTGKTLDKFVYVERSDIEYRLNFEYWFLKILCTLPMMIYNYFKK